MGLISLTWWSDGLSFDYAPAATLGFSLALGGGRSRLQVLLLYILLSGELSQQISAASDTTL